MEDPDAIYRIQIPLPLPLSWGRTVKPYVPRKPYGQLPPPAAKAAATAASATQQQQEQDGKCASKENKDVNGEGSRGVPGPESSAYFEEADPVLADYKAICREFQVGCLATVPATALQLLKDRKRAALSVPICDSCLGLQLGGRRQRTGPHGCASLADVL
jgi:hypothetical protein